MSLPDQPPLRRKTMKFQVKLPTQEHGVLRSVAAHAGESMMQFVLTATRQRLNRFRRGRRLLQEAASRTTDQLPRH